MIEEILGSKTETRVLLYFGRRPYEQLYLSEICKRLSMGLGRTSDVLKKLQSLEIIIEEKEGKKKMYKLNPNHVLYTELVRLSNLNELLNLPQKYVGSMRELTDRLVEKLKYNLVSIILYGSVARDEADKYSDMDIIVITRKSEKDDEIHRICDNVSDIFSERLETRALDKKELEERYRLGDDFLINVMKDGIVVYDPEGYYSNFLSRGIPKVSKELINKKLEKAHKWLENAGKSFKSSAEASGSLLGISSIHLAGAFLLLNDVLPLSRRKIPKQLEVMGERKFAKVYKQTREWEERQPLELDKDEVWEYLSFLREKYRESVMLLQKWQ